MTERSGIPGVPLSGGSLAPYQNADLDRKTLNTAIRAEFVEMFVSQSRAIDRSSADKMLSRALKRVKRKHRTLTHYLAWTLVGDHDPRDFRLGPVRFIHESKFFEEYGPKIEADHRSASTKQRSKAEEMPANGCLAELMLRDEWEDLDRKMLDWVTEYYKPLILDYPSANLADRATLDGRRSTSRFLLTFRT